MAATILDEIVRTKRDEVAAARQQTPTEMLHERIAAAPTPRDFLAAVTRPGAIRLIAEIKKASPSAGLIRADFDPVEIARAYESAGAAALSVLTDRSYFQGELSFISAVKRAVALPVLRKDFVIDEYQVYESRAAGADAVLLIAAILSVEQLQSYSSVATGLGMACLVEAHDENELYAALSVIDSGSRILIGINNRDLHAQRIDLTTTARLGAKLAGRPFVAESGLRTAEDVAAMRRAGAAAVLIGETFMRSPDISAKVREVMGGG